MVRRWIPIMRSFGCTHNNFYQKPIKVFSDMFFYLGNAHLTNFSCLVRLLWRRYKTSKT
jgi:hypothetical protein